MEINFIHMTGAEIGERMREKKMVIIFLRLKIDDKNGLRNMFFQTTMFHRRPWHLIAYRHLVRP